MSEYQYYEFVAVDRPLGPGQMAQLRALSTRARITPTGFERAAAAAREQRLQGLADREDEAWLRAAALIDTKRPTDYDAAVDLLRDLQAVSERTGAGAVFTRRMQQLREQHRRKPSLIERLHRAGLTESGRSEMSGIPK